MTSVLAPPTEQADQPRSFDAPLASLGAGRTSVKLRWITGELLLASAVLATTAMAVATSRDWGEGTLQRHLVLSAAAAALWIVILVRGRLYQARFISTRLQEWRRLLNGCGLATLIVLAIGSVVLERELSRAWVLIGSAALLVALGVEREVVRHLFSRARRSGRLLRDVVIVGANAEGATLRSVIDADPELGYRFVGFVETGEPAHPDVPRDSIVAPLVDLERFVIDSGVDNVIMAGSAVDPHQVKALTRTLVGHGVHVELSPVLPDTSIERVTLHQLGPHPLVYLEPAVQSGLSATAKRLFDIAFSLTALVAASPLLVLTAVAIKLDSRGPVFFRQVRLGHHGRRFPVLKFRSMAVDAEARKADLLAANESSGPLFKLQSDPRVTRVGALIRRFGIDELPQFFNVLRGDMSVVGPRPALPAEAESWPAELHHRLRARPGITGMWQIMGEERHDFEQYVRLDLYYVDNWSLFTDLSIVLRTIPSVLSRKGD
jgi:exopolysaccharide biosynthesis polyprenyl glycosylphosphotransferase